MVGLAGILGRSAKEDFDVEQLKYLPEMQRIRDSERDWIRRNMGPLREKAIKNGIGMLDMDFLFSIRHRLDLTAKQEKIQAPDTI